MECISGDDCFMKLDNDSYIFFYFTAKWCGPCQKIKPMILKLKDGLQTDKIKFYMIDIDENDDLCDKCKITSVPTFILFKDKESVGIVNGSNIVSVAELIKPYC